jgi:hypothetical protein
VRFHVEFTAAGILNPVILCIISVTTGISTSSNKLFIVCPAGIMLSLKE